MSLIFSLILGVIAWAIPIFAMMPKGRNGGYFYVIASLVACAFSVQVQLVEVVRDLSNDTLLVDEKFDFLIFACGLVMVGTFFFIGLSVYVKKKKK